MALGHGLIKKYLVMTGPVLRRPIARLRTRRDRYWSSRIKVMQKKLTFILIVKRV